MTQTGMTQTAAQSKVTFRTDSEAALASYLKQGFHIEPDVLTASECDAILLASQNLPSYQEGTLAPVMNPHNLEPVFLDALGNRAIVGIVEKLVSGKVNGLQTQFFFCQPGTPGFTMHQDNFYVQSKQDAFASAWVALTDVSPENGGLVVYPGSHLEPVLPTEFVEQPDNFGQDPNANRQQVILPDKYEPVDVYVKKGGAVFIHGHIVHKSHNNSTADRLRQALLMLYVRKGEPFRSGYGNKRSEIEIYG
jgi:hypothetical protein